MTATNHALTGAIIGLTLKQPVTAIPLAILSHYLLDVLPHYGSATEDNEKLKGRFFRNYLIAEALICFLIVLVLAIAQPSGWVLGALCAFFAAAPDLLSMNRYFTIRSGKKWRAGAYTRFASAIQWFERPIGGFVEIAWFGAASYLLSRLLSF